MNPTTQHIIDFLSRPELPFGAEEDLLFLGDAQFLRERVSSLLEENPVVLGREASDQLKSRLDEADWPFIAEQFRARVEAASTFFDGDAGASSHPRP